MADETYGTSTTEALLKMADEGLASIEEELKQSKKPAKKVLKKNQLFLDSEGKGLNKK